MMRYCGVPCPEMVTGTVTEASGSMPFTGMMLDVIHSPQAAPVVDGIAEISAEVSAGRVRGRAGSGS